MQLNFPAEYNIIIKEQHADNYKRGAAECDNRRFE